MASIIPSLLFLSLLSHSLLLGKCNEDDDLLKGIQQYRANLNLTALATTTVAECIADEIADTYQNQSCTNATTFNATAFNATTFPSYAAIMSKCVLNATNASGSSQILPTCIPNQQNLVVSDFTSKYATYLNSTGYSSIGVGSEDDWLVVLLTNITGISPNGASGLTLAAIGPVVLPLLCLFMLV
ncbi:uncharacterized GPI-anchored protein At5g19250-like [Salvia miltiorrhiza]|uniref:uncharacterized GPI-anchored protein At5g19250-like n=1 Tax=Salvia miltiorrhiza TaxID=226208 RepID=UPI0025AD53B5|nr:uncharacterized GPI-anchored protein At5g19250-like [Salvia miltiorrhiza]